MPLSPAGKLLPTPEQVPFRLTRDVVDGLGVSGTRGAFEASCAVTLAGLRRSADTVLALLRVFLADPLFRWSLSPDHARRMEERKTKSLLQQTSAGGAGAGVGAGTAAVGLRGAHTARDASVFRSGGGSASSAAAAGVPPTPPGLGAGTAVEEQSIDRLMHEQMQAEAAAAAAAGSTAGVGAKRGRGSGAAAAAAAAAAAKAGAASATSGGAGAKRPRKLAGQTDGDETAAAGAPLVMPPASDGDDDGDDDNGDRGGGDAVDEDDDGTAGGAGAGAGAAAARPQEGNTLRVMARVQSKLSGSDYSDVAGGVLPVEAQVRRAISEATDPARWAVMYHGWSAYL